VLAYETDLLKFTVKRTVEGYGSNWISNSKGKWLCMDWNSGETKYETEWLTKGGLIYEKANCSNNVCIDCFNDFNQSRLC